uniref:TnpV protein n=1 Tax=Maledivibacter halophilus TaxID=36842 RepID=UPI0038BCAB81
MTYKDIDGILYPEIQISSQKEADEKPLGKYGRMALKYMRENHTSRYSYLLSEGQLMPLIHKVDKEAKERLERIMKQLLEKDPIPNPMNTMESAKHRMMIKTMAEEIIQGEIIYKKR